MCVLCTRADECITRVSEETNKTEREGDTRTHIYVAARFFLSVLFYAREKKEKKFNVRIKKKDVLSHDGYHGSRHWRISSNQIRLIRFLRLRMHVLLNSIPESTPTIEWIFDR